MRPIRRLGAALLGLLATAPPAVAQDSARVVVAYIAGANVYLAGGADAGIRAGDTLRARRLPDGAMVGALLVMASVAERSVVAFLGAPFPLTRGDTLAVAIAHAAPTAAAAVAVRPVVPSTGPPPPRPARIRTGSVSLDVDVAHTRTTGLGADPQVNTYDFATPSLGLQYRDVGRPGALELRTSLRATQRSSSQDIVAPATLVQVYELTLSRRTVRSLVSVGRFFSPYESFTGYWDGVLLHRGNERFGAGVLAGFEPDRGNSGFRTAEPKLGVVLHGRTAGRAVRYRTELAFDAAFPERAPRAHLLAGWGQGLQLGDLSLRNDLQLDREPVTGHWVATRLLSRVSARLGAAGSLYAGYTIRQPYLDRTLVSVIPFRRDQVSAGMTWWSGALGGAFDVSTSQQRGLSSQWAYSGSASYRPRRPGAFGGSLAATYWTESEASGTLVTPTLARRVGAADLSLGYQFYRSVLRGTATLSHGIDLGGRLPLAGRTQFSFRARQRFGGHLQSSGLYAGLWYGF